MCHSDRSIDHRSTTPEKARDEETVLDETPPRERPTGDIVKVPVKALKRVKAVLPV